MTFILACLATFIATGKLPSIPKDRMKYISGDPIANTQRVAPLMKYYKETGDIPFWHPYIFGGMPSWGALVYTVYPKWYVWITAAAKLIFWLYIFPMILREEL